MSDATPALIPPPTAIDDTHKVYTIAIAVGILAGVTTLAAISRLFIRWRSGALGLDDYAFVPALVSTRRRICPDC